ncbi:MAG: hypothetical protein HC842_06330, partial [Cytophagales bacterium]|nr:hypothetical protein [Cytophagales bacterium]
MKLPTLYSLALILLLAFAGCQPSTQSAFVLVEGSQEKAGIYLPAQEGSPIRLAVQDLVNDVEKVTGVRLEIISNLEQAPANTLMICNLADSAQK